MAIERGEATTGICFGNKGPLRRIYDGDGKKIDYAVPFEPDSSQNGVHSNGVNSAGINAEPLRNEGIL